MRAEQRRLRLLRELANACDEAVRAFRDHDDERELIGELERRIQDFAQSDPEAHRLWANYRDLTLRVMITPALQYIMLHWYTGGPEGNVQDASRSVPPRLHRQIERVAQYFTYLGRLQFRLEQAEFDLRQAESPGDPPRNEPIDEGGMASMSDYDLFGYERRDAHSAFGRYVTPLRLEGDGEAQLAHVRDSFAVRRIRVLHADSEREHAILLQRLRSFRWSAVRALNELSENDQLSSDLQERIAREMSTIHNFQWNILRYQGPTGGVRAAEEESNASFNEPIESGVAATAASEMSEEDGEEEEHGEEGEEDDDDEDEDEEYYETSEEQSEDQSEE
jgi:hypothetical protein